MKKWKKTSLGLLSIAMGSSMLTFTPVAAAASLINHANFAVMNQGGTELNDGSTEKVSNNITSERIKNALFDGNTSTYWQSATVDNGVTYGNEGTSLIIDLGADYKISEIIYKARPNGSNFEATGNPNGTIFIDLAATYNGTWDSENDVEGSAPTNWGNGYNGSTSVTFDETIARYVRVSADSSYHWQSENQDKILCIADLEIYGSNADGSEVAELPRNVASQLSADQIQAVFSEDGTNAKASATDRPLTKMFDGIKANAEYSHFSSDNERKSSYLQFDLGDVYNLSEIKMWRYADGSRKYTNTIILVSEDEQFNTYEVVYNSDATNVHGLNLEANDEDYVEETTGKSFTVNNVNARFVRMYMYGNTAGNQNHVVEIEVYGVSKKETASFDTSALNALIQAVEALTEETYSIKSWSNLMGELAEAKAVLNEAASQEEIDLATAELEEMKNLLVDRSPLKTILDQVSLKLAETDKYTEETYNALKEVYDEGMEAYSNTFSDYVQADVYFHVDRIQEKLNALEEKPAEVVLNKEALIQLIQEVEALADSEVIYSKKSWTNMQAALTSARTARDEATTQEEIDAAKATLQEKKDKLVDRSAMKVAMEAAEAKLAETDKYTAASYNELKRVYDDCVFLYENTAINYVQADVTFHVDNITTAIANLEEKPVEVVLNKEALIRLIQEVEALKQNDYSIKSWSDLTVVLAQARTARDEATTQAAIDTAKNALQAKKDQLVNRTALKTALNAAEVKLAETDKYTTDSYNALKTVYDAGKALYENATINYSANDVTPHVNAINAAIANLKVKEAEIIEVLDKSPLEAKIAEASAIEADAYYAPSFDALGNAIADANNALNTVLTNEDVASEVAKLQAAIDALITRPARVTNLNAYALNYKTIQIDWDAVEGATYYQIYRLNTQTGKWIKFKTSDTNSYTVTGVKTGVRYSYRVIANKVLADGTIVAGKSSSTNNATALLEGEPVLTLKANGKTKFDLSWTKVEGATRYLVYRKSNTEGWKKVLTLGGDVTTYTTSSMVPNTYTYMIKAARYDSKERTQTNGSNTCEAVSVFDAPQIIVAKASSTSAKVSWKAVEGVTYYEVYRATDNGAYTKLVTTTSLNYTCKSLKKGKTYQFKVKAYRTYNNGKVYTDFSDVETYKVK